MLLRQDSRPVAIKAALGSELLAVLPSSFQERLGRLFQVETDLIGQRGSELERGARVVGTLISNTIQSEAIR